MTVRRLAAIAALLASLPAYPEGLRRFAIVVGNDEGGSGTRPLFYARDDAKRIASILQRIGGVRPEDSVLLLNGTADQLLAAMGDIERRSLEATRQGEHTALFLYYSGHAKEGALRLGDTTLPFASVKSRLAQAPADIRIGIFDACQSGLLTRSKGARKAPEFAIEADAARDAKGLVILTSSASDEDSQESDQIGGSYFSHHLASGLLGDADRSGDGKVSLSEAYAYAYERTVADTSDSAAGAQHPTFSYDLAGNGDLVLTDVQSHREGILFPSIAPDGTYYIVDAKGSVAAEIVKFAEKEKRIALAPGVYRVKRRLPDHLRVGEVTVGAGQIALFDESRLRDVPFSADPVKGVDRAWMLGTQVSFGIGAGYQSFFDGSTRSELFPSSTVLNAEVNFHNLIRRDWVWGLDLATGSSRADVQQFASIGLPDLPFSFTEVSLGTTVLKEWGEGDWRPFLGARAAMILLTRTFDPVQDTVLPKQFFATVTPGLVAGVEYRISRHWLVVGRARVHFLFYNLDQNSVGQPFWEMQMAVNYEL
jgi:hypothetical protein